MANIPDIIIFNLVFNSTKKIEDDDSILPISDIFDRYYESLIVVQCRKCAALTCPPPLSLLVSLTLLKETGAFIQCAPKFGESGCMYTQLEVRGSGLPPATHSPFTYFHRCESAAEKSSRNEYMALGSRPDTLTFSTGNMRLYAPTNTRHARAL